MLYKQKCRMTTNTSSQKLDFGKYDDNSADKISQLQKVSKISEYLSLFFFTKSVCVYDKQNTVYLSIVLFQRSTTHIKEPHLPMAKFSTAFFIFQTTPDITCNLPTMLI